MLTSRFATTAVSAAMVSFILLALMVLLIEYWHKWFARVLWAVFAVSAWFTFFAIIGTFVVGVMEI